MGKETRGGTVASGQAAVMKNILVVGAFLVFFGILLLPIPRSGSLLGSVDSLFVPAFSNTYLNRLVSLVTGEFVGQAMFPANISQFGETFVGESLLFMAFRLAGASDVYSQYASQVVMLATTGYAAYLLSRRFLGDARAAVFVAVAFSTTNYMWADIDHLYVHFYALPLLSVYFLKGAADESNPRSLLLGGIFGGLTALFSVQMFVYQSILVAVVVLFRWRALTERYSLAAKGTFFTAYALIPLPLLVFYLNTVLNLTVMDPFPRSMFEQFYSLQLPDLLSALPHKLISYPFVAETQGGWHLVSHSAFPGLLVLLLSALALMRPRLQHLEFLGIASLGLLFALGTMVTIGDRTLTSPLAVFYRMIPLAGFLRVGSRSYSLVLLGLTLLAGAGLARLLGSLRRRSRRLPDLLVALCIAVVALENLSWPVNEYEVIPYPSIPLGYIEFFEDKPQAVILDLPARSTTWPGYIDEIVYVLWQTQHRRTIVGGVSGYFPASRIEAQSYTDLLPSEEAFQYFRDLGVTHMVWHDSPFLVCRAPHSQKGCDPLTGGRSWAFSEAYSWMNSADSLRLVLRNELISVYELVDPTSGGTASARSEKGSR